MGTWEWYLSFLSSAHSVDLSYLTVGCTPTLWRLLHVSKILMSTEHSAVTPLGLMMLGLNADRELGLGSANTGCFFHPAAVFVLFFSSKVVGAQFVQYAFCICPGDHLVWCLFDCWLRLLRIEKKNRDMKNAAFHENLLMDIVLLSD